MSLVRGLAETGVKAAKKTAPFYSAVDEALANLKRPKGTGIEFLTEVLKQPGVKKAEIADRKLEQAFKAKGKMTKEEAQQVLKENPPPKLQERVLDESLIKEEDELRDIVSEEFYGMPYDRLDNNRARGRVFDEAFRRMGEENGPIYGDYKTPGGKNYREILLKLPSRRPNASNYTDPAKYDADMRLFNSSGKSDYQSSHWKEDPNVLAHMRVQDRTGPNGEKILHVEEIQSDWHQEGRKKGYQTGINYEKQWKDYQKELLNKYGIDSEDRNLAGIYSDLSGNATPEEMNKLYELKDLVNAESKGVPDAPFKKNWHELAMKRLLNYAADNGYDSIAITPGAEQAKRYDLSKQINNLQYDELGDLRAFDKDGRMVISENVDPEKLPDYVGKELAAKILSNRENRMKSKDVYRQALKSDAPEEQVDALYKEYLSHPIEYSGVDLQVGGEGMKGFYDKILPDYLNTFGKQYGVQVGQMPIEINKGMHVPNPEGGWTTTPPETYSAHNFPITPEMRESIKQKGLPLYQQVGIPTAGAGAASQTTQEEPEYGVGGSVAKMAALAKLQKLKEEMAPRAAVVKDLMAKDSNQYLRDVTPDVLTNDYIEQEIARMKAKAEASKPEVKLADGGAINFNTAPDMSDGGRIMQGAPFKRGGKVNMTANRDTMFMELSNKKLKRK